MNKYVLWDTVNIVDHKVQCGVIIAIEKVAIEPRLAPFHRLNDYLETLVKYQYEVAYEFEGQVYKDIFCEELIDE